ncbi:superoxide dismutase [Filobacillus milosensis]|uniref:superoxide dismutase n=1 Tax=Filobacillus milosensis TaxID=94137 RepID=A0A4Y8IXD4_9BACI|nr:superoxide dismutase [Filobacillus milosensis]TFB24035.1 superoxide dismutase [Filobacillus milosensis]
MSKTSFTQFLNDMYEWTERFKSKEKFSSLDLSNDEHNDINQQINELEQRIHHFRDSRDQLTHDQARELKRDAEELVIKWQRLFNKQDEKNENTQRVVGIGEHTLPPLPYAYDALEPYIDEKIMRLHHDKHHRGYVNGLNKAEREMEKARKKNDYDLIKHWEREAAFHGAGHYLHTIFWYIMDPDGGGKPKGDLLKAINQSFGSFDKFKKHFSEAAKNVESVGWAILVYSPRSHRLEILQAEKHQNLTQWDVIPLLVLDVWEHAYYLQYENNRGKYVDQWWNIVNWDEVEKRYKEAKKVKWKEF